jgi:hypothetical protein
MGSLFSLVFTLFVFLSTFCDARCCRNHNPWCVFAPDCEPNCPDGASYCDIQQACMNDGVGGCYDVSTVTDTVYYNLVVSTMYTSTEQQYSIETYTDYVATVGGETYYETSTITAVCTSL